MKMISSTSMTSTSGTTLISESDGGHARPAPRAARRRSVSCSMNFRHPLPKLACVVRADGVYVKFRSEMFRNSSEKSSISVANCFTRFVKWL